MTEERFAAIMRWIFIILLIEAGVFLLMLMILFAPLVSNELIHVR